jgi:hypothetical protein
MMQIWQDALNLLKAPIVGELDAKHLFLLIGLVLVFVAAWIMILHAVRDVAEEV